VPKSATYLSSAKAESRNRFGDLKVQAYISRAGGRRWEKVRIEEVKSRSPRVQATQLKQQYQKEYWGKDIKKRGNFADCHPWREGVDLTVAPDHTNGAEATHYTSDRTQSNRRGIRRGGKEMEHLATRSAQQGKERSNKRNSPKRNHALQQTERARTWRTTSSGGQGGTRGEAWSTSLTRKKSAKGRTGSARAGGSQ